MTAMEGIGGVIKRRPARQAGDPPPGKKGQLPGLESPDARKERRIHSGEHALAAEISAYFAERAKFGLYLGIVRRLGIAQARALFSSVKSDHADVRSPRKFFMWLSKSGKEEAASPKPEKKRGPKKKRPGKQLDMNVFLG